MRALPPMPRPLTRSRPCSHDAALPKAGPVRGRAGTTTTADPGACRRQCRGLDAWSCCRLILTLDELTEQLRDDVDPAAEVAHRQLAGGGEAVSGRPADPENLRSARDGEQ